MNYFVVMNKNNATETHRQASIHSSLDDAIDLGNGQIKLEVQDRFDAALVGFIKYTSVEVDALVAALRDGNGDLIAGKTITSTQVESDSGLERILRAYDRPYFR